MTGGLDVTEVASGDDGLLDRVYAEILAPSFDPSELIDVETLRASHGAGVSTVVTARDPDGIIAAAAVWDREPGAPIALLSYLATRPGGRSRGVGGAVMATLLADWGAPAGPSAVLAEVHDPAHWPTTAHERPKDRLRFYARLGARRLTVPWIQPRVAVDQDRVRAMLLLVLSARPPMLVGPSELDGAATAVWARGYYTDAEGASALDDPEVASLLRSLDVPTLELVTLDDVLEAHD